MCEVLRYLSIVAIIARDEQATRWVGRSCMLVEDLSRVIDVEDHKFIQGDSSFVARKLFGIGRLLYH